MEAEEEALYVACVMRLAVDIDILQICLRGVLGISICDLIFRCFSRYTFGGFEEQRRRTCREIPVHFWFL